MRSRTDWLHFTSIGPPTVDNYEKPRPVFQYSRVTEEELEFALDERRST